MSSRRALRAPFAVAAAVALAATAGGVAVTVGSAQAATARVYYVAPDGSDANAGTSPAAPWKSLTKVTSASLAPGDRVLLKSSGSYPGSLRIDESGNEANRIVVGSYGDGALPQISGGCVRVEGSWVTIRTVHTTRCDWAGIAIKGDHVRVARSQSTHNVTGIHVGSGSEYAVVSRNDVIDNTEMSVNTPGGDDDSGAFGILVNGDHSNIRRNRIFGHHTHSYDYGTDGAAVEVYQSIGTRVHHNIAGQNHAFTELGGPRTRDTVYAYNVSRSTLSGGDFLVTRGAESGWGPVLNTTVLHNTVVEGGNGSQGFVCHAGCGPDILTMRGNIISANWKVGYADGAFAGGDNVYWGGQRQFPPLAGDQVTEPQFVNPGAGDLRLRPGAPGIDRLDRSGWRKDAAWRSSFVDGDGDGVARSDVGAYES